ncbi:MAG: Gfo/Idh/MocA family oxidoreductase [Deltaproteobacteria bacterium]|nr:Gfo/Idh/MocA family oxidoreductase [Deltaproteobacteria bacterium]
MSYLAIIGAGQIGSRHLQGLAHLNRVAHIQVVDPSPDSLACSQERFNQVRGSGNVTVEFLTNLRDLNNQLDLAIIATTADVRRKITEQLIQEKLVKNLILEKIVFQSESDFASIATLLIQKEVKAWINCPFRMWQGYQKIASLKPRNLQFHVTGSQWNLACNSIHYLDIFCLLTGTIPIKISSDKLDPGSIPSKRKNFVEITGTLTGTTQNGCFSLTSWREGHAPVTVHMTSDNLQCTVREDLGRAWIAVGESSWTMHEELFPTPFQSQLTHLAVQEILDHDISSLPDFVTSWKVHTPILRAISSHLGGAQPCPIT